MNILGRWGLHILVPQLVFGGIVYAVTVYHGLGDFVALVFAFITAGLVAVFFVAVTIVGDKPIGLSVTLSSLSMVLAVVCFLSFADVAGGIFLFLSIVTAVLAAMLEKEKSAESELFFFRVLSALPVVGAARHLLGRLDEKMGKVLKG